MRKGAVALSVNFLVVIIIAIVILGLSFFLFSRVIKEVKEFDEQLDEQYEEQIWRLLDTGGVVVAPRNTQTVERGNVGRFGIGVRNIIEEEPILLFSIEVSPQTVGLCEAKSEWLIIPRDKDRNIIRHTQDIFLIGVDIPKDTPKCTYVYNVNVTYGIDPYGTMQKIYVDVP